MTTLHTQCSSQPPHIIITTLSKQAIASISRHTEVTLIVQSCDNIHSCHTEVTVAYLSSVWYTISCRSRNASLCLQVTE
jgi:hypothetical protein